MKLFNNNLLFLLTFVFLSACANANDSISDEKKLDFIKLIKSIAEKPPKNSASIELAFNIKLNKLINKDLEKEYLISASKDSVAKSIFIEYAELRNAYQLPRDIIYSIASKHL